MDDGTEEFLLIMTGVYSHTLSYCNHIPYSGNVAFLMLQIVIQKLVIMTLAHSSSGFTLLLTCHGLYLSAAP